MKRYAQIDAIHAKHRDIEFARFLEVPRSFGHKVWMPPAGMCHLYRIVKNISQRSENHNSEYERGEY